MNAPDPGTVGFYMDPDTVLTAVWRCAASIGNTALVPQALILLGSFTLIIVVWTGLKFMFSGSFDLGSAVSMLFTILFAYSMLTNYYDRGPAVWGGGDGFVFMVAGQAVNLAREILGDADSILAAAYTDARTGVARREAAVLQDLMTDPGDRLTSFSAEEDPDQRSLFAGIVDLVFMQLQRLFMTGMENTTAAVLWIIGWMVYAQYLWGFFGLAVLSMLGPIFIPFILIQQFDFLFWGWFKAMLQCAIYMLTSAVMYVVVASLLVAPMARMAQIPLPSSGAGSSLWGMLEFYVRMYLEFVPLLVVCFFAALKVGSISGSIMAGSAPGGAGLGSAIAYASGKLDSFAPKAAGGVAPVPTPLSQSGAPPSVQRAYIEARQRLGVPVGSTREPMRSAFSNTGAGGAGDPGGRAPRSTGGSGGSPSSSGSGGSGGGRAPASTKT